MAEGGARGRFCRAEIAAGMSPDPTRTPMPGDACNGAASAPAEEKIPREDGFGKTKEPAAPAGPAAPAAPAKDPRDTQIMWENVIAIILAHVAGVYFFCACITHLKWQTWLWTIFYLYTNGTGVTAGVHRFWTHRCYKVKLPLRIVLMLFYSAAGMNSIYDWVRDHRVHHKFSDTDADPHNISRGWFFAHCGWLMRRKHPEVHRRGRMVDMSDVLADPVARFQRRFHLPLKILTCFLLPTVVPPLYWGETWFNAFAANWIRYLITLNSTWSVNSFAHMYGAKPFDKRIAPAENPYVSCMTMGEGWHNYHHVFPWDYKAAELGYINGCKHLLDWWSRLGWVYDLKAAPPHLVRRVAERYGDGSWHGHWHAPEVPVDAVEKPELLDDILASGVKEKGCVMTCRAKDNGGST